MAPGWYSILSVSTVNMIFPLVSCWFIASLSATFGFFEFIGISIETKDVLSVSSIL